MAETIRQFSLKHVKHESKQSNILYSMLLEKNLVDVILCCDTTNISAHRLILSANSSYFKNLFDSLESNRCQIPIIVLKDVPLSDLQAIIEFMYKGEVLVDERHLSSVLKSAELLKVFGLTEVCHALRSRLNNESNAETTSSSHPSPQKRPRISDGIKQKTQQSTDIFAGLCNTRIEYRAPTHSTPVSLSSQSNQQQLRSTVSIAPATSHATVYTTSHGTSHGISHSTAHATAHIPALISPTYSPTVVKNVILPLEQIHRKTDSVNVNKSKESNISTTIQPIRVISSPVRSPPINSYSRGTPVAKQTPTAQKSSTNEEVWIPSQTISSPSPSTSATTSAQTKSPVEVLIDDETNEAFDETHDIKPLIFELNQNLSSSNKNIVFLDIENDSNKSESQNQILVKRKTNSFETPKSDIKGLKAIKSRTASTSSQSCPPPPSYRVVQRSSSRLLRNIIKPTSVASTSSVKGKDNSDDKNKTSVKRDRQTLRRKSSKSEFDSKSSDSYCDESPEVECPSCGLKFNDDKTWNEHITSAHPPVNT